MGADEGSGRQMANEHKAVAEHREMALEFYRANMHGTGWKVETGDFESALSMLASYAKDCVKARDFATANQVRGMRAHVAAYAKQVTKQRKVA